MPIRMPVVAGAFYPLQADACKKELERHLRQAMPPDVERHAVAALVPHAGWVYSGTAAAYVYNALARNESPDTFVLFGAVHRWGVEKPAVYPSGAWRTPLGDALIDSELAEALVGAARGIVISDTTAHSEEHSIEVQLPFIQLLFPQARILPVAVPPEQSALVLGRLLFKAVQDTSRKVIVIASSDLTHYGPRYGYAPAGIGPRGLEWTRQNDAALLEIAAQMRASELMQQAERMRSACGSGGIAAAIEYANKAGASKGILLHYTTSYDVMPAGRPSDLVGYGAMVFA